MAISDAQFAAWMLRDSGDPAVLAGRCVLVELDYQYELAGVPATGTLYFSDKVYFDGTGAHPYVDAIAGVPEYSRSLSGNQLGTYSSSIGTLELDNADASQDYLLTLAIDGSAIRFYLGDVTWARSDFRFIFSALSTKAVATSFDRVSVQLKDTGLLLDKSIGGTIKVGGTGPNADQWRPVNFGLVHQVECMVLDPVNLVYVHSDTGYGMATSAGSFVQTVRDRGVPVVFTDNGDGTFTLAASPAGTITADLLYVAPPAPGSANRAISDAFGFFIRDRCGLGDLGLYYGPGPTYSARPDTGIAAWVAAGGEDYFIGQSIRDKRNAIDLLGDLTDSGLCFWAIRRDGKWTCGRLRPSYIAILGLTASHTLTEDSIDGSFQIDRLAPSYYSYQATMSKNWSIQTDLASSLSAADHAKLIRPGLPVLQNDGVGTDYANAPQNYHKTLVPSPTIDTLLSGADDTTDPALLQLWMETRRAMSLPWISQASVTTGIECYDVELGDPVTVKAPRFSYDAGVDFQCTGITIKLPSKVDLKLIRRDVQASYGSRPTTPPGGAPFSGAAKMFIATASFIAGVATGTGTGTAPPAPIDAFTATVSFIPGTASGDPNVSKFPQSNYVTIGNDANLTNERALTAGSGISITDNGANSTVVVAATGSGGVTSVGLTVPAEFSVSGSPVTGSGTLAVTKANENANTVWAGPSSGSAAQPTFRALVDSDIPTFISRTWLWGDGSDGAFTADGAATPGWATLAANVYTMTRNAYLTDLTINTGITIKTQGFQLWGTGTLTGASSTSIISCNGIGATSGNGVSLSLNAVYGSAGVANPGSGGNGQTGSAAVVGGPGNGFPLGGNGSAGGNGEGAGAAGGTNAAILASSGGLHGASIIFGALTGKCIFGGTTSGIGGTYGAGAGGGGGGKSIAGNGGGGGGSGAFMVGVLFLSIAGTGTINAVGGAGAAGQGGNASGGGGGGGGVIFVVTRTANWNSLWSTSVAGGNGGAASGSGAAGTQGVSGNVFSFIV